MAVTYHANNWLPVRIIDHVRLGLSPTIQSHKANLLEKAGNAGVWFIENMPRKVMRLAQDPRVVTAAVTALAMLADTYLFYPVETMEYLGKAAEVLSTVPFWQVKLAAYLFTCGTILSYGCRAEGRFLNSDLMDRFYHGRAGEMGDHGSRQHRSFDRDMELDGDS